jgi:uncharacterized membrane protein
VIPTSIQALRVRAHELRYGLLLVPSVLAIALIVLGVALSSAERHAGTRGFDVVFTGDAAAARSTLTVLAEGIATILGISFSITIVALQLVSQQFSPRALRNFLADRVTQVMAGFFVGTFGYALVVLRVVHGPTSSKDAFVPTASISVAILLGLGSLAVLLGFFHHMVRTVQVAEIAADIARSTLASLDRLYPERFGAAAEEDPQTVLDAWRSATRPRVIVASRPGFVQRVAIEDLPARLGHGGARIHIAVAPGDFVTPRDAIAEVWTAGGGPDLERALRATIVVGSGRDIEQDALFGVRQLADIAIKAISPAVNDPSTAWTAIRYIESIIEQMAGRALPPPVRRCRNGDRQIDVIARRASFADYVEVGFVQIGRHASRDARVAEALLDAIAGVALAATDASAADRLPPLLAAAEDIAGPAHRAATTHRDRYGIEDRTSRVRRLACAASG